MVKHSIAQIEHINAMSITQKPLAQYNILRLKASRKTTKKIKLFGSFTVLFFFKTVNKKEPGLSMFDSVYQDTLFELSSILLCHFMIFAF